MASNTPFFRRDMYLDIQLHNSHMQYLKRDKAFRLIRNIDAILAKQNRINYLVKLQRKVKMKSLFKRNTISMEELADQLISTEKSSLNNIVTDNIKVTKPTSGFNIFQERHRLSFEIKGTDVPRITPEFLLQIQNDWSIPKEAYLEINTQKDEYALEDAVDDILHCITYTWITEKKPNTEGEVK